MTYERVKPSGAMSALRIYRSVDGPIADAERKRNETQTKVERNGIGIDAAM